MKLLREIGDWEEDWPRPVRAEMQWRVGRSAAELARAFIRSGTPRVPDTMHAAFRATPRLADIEFLEGLPELTTSLPPEGTPGPRHHDMWLRGYLGDCMIGIGVEAKVDEPFDDPISHKYRAAVDSRNAGKSTHKPERYQAVASLVLRRSVSDDEMRLCPLRYQLVSGVAGTLIQASLERRPISAFLVYELITESSVEKKRNLNQTDFDIFLETIGAHRESTSGLFGPLLYLPGHGLQNPVELWLGKVSENIAPEHHALPKEDDALEEDADTRELFLNRCALHLATRLAIPLEDIESNHRRVKASLPRRSSVFLRVEATNNRPRRVEVTLKAGAAQVARWPKPRETDSAPAGVTFEQWKDGGFTRSGFKWHRASAEFRSSQQRAYECIDFLAKWANSIP